MMRTKVKTEIAEANPESHQHISKNSLIAWWRRERGGIYIFSMYIFIMHAK